VGEAPARPSVARVRRRLAALLALSGAAGLTLEVVWARHLALLLGSSAAAHATVVATFMAGLALGYAWGGRRAARWRRPLVVYGLLELSVGLWAAATPALLAVSRWAVVAALARWGAGSAGGAAAQVGVAALFLLPPTVAMGATLPTLTALLARHEPRRAPTSVALLYAWNSAGAAAGALVAGFAVLPRLGLTHATWVAAGAEALIAGAALAWGLGGRALRAAPDAHEPDSQPHPTEPDAPSPEPLSSRPSRELLALSDAVALAGGLASMALQGLWFRLFGLFLGSSSDAFTVVLGAFIASVALGAALARRTRTSASAAIAVAGMVAAAALLVTGGLYERGPFWVGTLKAHALAAGWSFDAYTLARAGLVVALVALPATALGALLPLAARLRSAGGRAGAGAGRAFALNTVGAVLGAGLAVPVLVPAVGLSGVFAGVVVTATTLAGLAAVAWRREVWRRLEPSLRRPGEISGLAGACALCVVLAGAAAPRWDPRVLSAGAFRGRGLHDASFQAFQRRVRRSVVVFHEDGPLATVAVLERRGDRVLTVDGKPDASTRGDMVTQVASAHVPLLLHPGPRRALVIGLGSGVTAGSAALHPADTPSGRLAVDVVELSPAVVEASRCFDAWSGGPLGSARGEGTVTLIEDDARSALLAAEAVGQRWDVIISEPSNPWVAGNASLFTREMFERMRGRLRPGGVLAQWIQLYETDDEALRLVVRTLRAVFPKVTAWVLYPTDLLLVAGNAEWEPDLEGLGRRAREPAVAADLARVGIDGPEGLLSLQALGPRGVDALLAVEGNEGAAGIHTDDRPWLEFAAPRWLFGGGRAEMVRRLDGRGAEGDDAGGDARWRELWGARYAEAHPPSFGTLAGLFRFHTRYPGAPPSYRTERLLPAMLAAGSEGAGRESPEGWEEVVTDVAFTMARESRWEALERVARALLARPGVGARALYAVAWGRTQALEAGAGAPGGWAGVAALLDRCVGAGDEPRGRCSRLSGELRRAGRVL